MRKSTAKHIALGGVTAALAVVVQCLGGLIPFATYAVPILCASLLSVVTHLCGNRIGWTWYAAVALLGLLLGPDKEAAALFVFLGYYPIIRPKLEQRHFPRLWKFLLFQFQIVLMYGVLIFIFGMDQLLQEATQWGVVFLGIFLVLGNLIFFLWDRALGRIAEKF